MSETIGRYEILRPLGQGGVGAVFLAYDPALERQVALKLLHVDPTHSGLRDEAKALAALRHPGIVTIFVIHAWEYPIARRDAKTARYYIGLAGLHEDWLDFSLGHYERVAKTPGSALAVPALIVLGRMSAPEVEAQLTGSGDLALVYRVAAAAGAGDLARAHRELAPLWPRLDAKAELPAEAFYTLESLGEIVLSAGMKDDTRRLVALLARQAHDHRARGYERFSMLAAALLHDPALVIARPRSERDARLGDAARAVLAGDHAGAAAILRALVANPTFSWDYPERAALLRELRALHRRREAAALCADTLRPAVFRPAFLALRHACAR